MEKFFVNVDSAVKFQVLRQALVMVDAIKNCAPEYAQPLETPLLTPDIRPAFLRNHFKNQSVFLACSGPSLTSYDLKKLEQRGVMVMAVNNAGSLVRPHLWCCADPPYRFCQGIWQDPAIMKFVPTDMLTLPVNYYPEGKDYPVHEEAGSMPNVLGYIRNLKFDPNCWLDEPSVYLGQTQDQEDPFGHKGVRSVLLVALKLLYHLGFRKVYLLGCDFHMREGEVNYAFGQIASAGSIKGNSRAYPVLNERLTCLQEKFLEAGFQVFNCNPKSGLTAFPFVDFETAVESMVLPESFVDATGLYDRKSLDMTVRELQVS